MNLYLIALLEDFRLQFNCKLDAIINFIKQSNQNKSCSTPITSPKCTSISLISSDAMMMMMDNDGDDSFHDSLLTNNNNNDDNVISCYGAQNNQSLQLISFADDNLKMSSDLILNSIHKSPIEVIKTIKQEQVCHLTSRLNYASVPLGVFFTVRLSFIYSSRNFYINLNFDEVEDFSLQLNKKYNDKSCKEQPVFDHVTLGTFYCFKNPNNNRYYRAQIVGDNGSKQFKILLVDFGEIINSVSNNLYYLDEEFATPIYAINCFIEGSSGFA